MLKTEMRNPKTKEIHKLSTLEQLKLMNEENMNAVNAVGDELPNIAEAVDAISEAMKNGGRLFYIGAGTSGRLGIIDAAECPPTFGVDDNTVIGIIAGGDSTLRKASEGAEDNPNAGIEDLKTYHFCEKDVLVGISAAGGAKYVVNALKYANALGSITVAVTSNKGTEIDQVAKISICPDTGAEVLTGSTRLKAGTSQKLILNMLSTISMVKCGYVYENLMINLKPTNIKLKARVIRIVCEILQCGEEHAIRELDSCEWNIATVVEKNM